MFPERLVSGEPLKLDTLADVIHQSIKTTGPLPLSSFMRQCLTHPTMGYYTTRDPFGSQGDFVTSPEISSMFGEIIGVWFFSVWLAQKTPTPVRFMEFGPGRGTLMLDVLRSFDQLHTKFGGEKRVPVDVLMVEASQVLREAQWKKLCHVTEGEVLPHDKETGSWSAITKGGGKITWVEIEKDVKDSDQYTNYVIAHEFYDALPIQQFQKTAQGWREFLVDFRSGEGEIVADSPQDFHLVLSPRETPFTYIPKTRPRFNDLPVGTKVEVCPDSFSYSKAIAEIISSNKNGTGASLIIDYGPEATRVPEQTLRGIRDHKFVSPFSDCGNVDLSADVDFGTIREIMHENGCKTFGPVEQGDWLNTMGLGYRTFQLVEKAATEVERTQLEDSFIRLVAKDDQSMGGIYKVLAVFPEGSDEVPVGFGEGKL
ncbi:hypothetical protein BABINDRAFT_34391 [Babjeviella inositovora NRRL Y-12698]|uniref:Protein arginine methyltransferase NDUFAF7 n=1 Tax=Babjeviella inositovora NRRL Y-12698 TaxID=984486 RepID=A0A1E3QUD0_9ASCO|nr:uncharacterized protein BABINDRAFT_34391 [Babjeviella inositovora NRRL Y-12698]ODQ81293.1 hypothetical protein BABINDRAFT_34391 [Babjeviella inositovora NRRL Y-12698]